MVSEQPLPQDLPMPRPMSLPDTVPNVQVSFQKLVNLRPLYIRLLCTLPVYDNDIDYIKQPEVTIRQPPEKIMYS